MAKTINIFISGSKSTLKLSPGETATGAKNNPSAHKSVIIFNSSVQMIKASPAQSLEAT
jgi:hypothetical protein